MRRSTNTILLGMLGGIAEHFKFNPFWLRLAVVLAVLVLLFTLQVWWLIFCAAAYVGIAAIMEKPQKPGQPKAAGPEQKGGS